MAKSLLLIIGIVLLFLKLKKIFIVHYGWIVLCFGLWAVLLIISIHNKNKDRNTPRPVYMVR